MTGTLRLETAITTDSLIARAQSRHPALVAPRMQACRPQVKEFVGGVALAGLSLISAMSVIGR